jgi:hypothetical protein
MPDNLGPWHFRLDRKSLFVIVPHRLPIALLAFLAAAPWIHWHFSLRAVLIGVAVASFLLGWLLYFGH